MSLDGRSDSIVSISKNLTDTTFVLFFLGMEFGRAIENFAFDGFLLLVTLVMVAVLPFYLQNSDERPTFGKWLMQRGSIAGFAVFAGLLLVQAYGRVIPESVRFLPLTLLIISAMVSSLAQFYGLMRLRLAK
jgi:hypothetical protein